jgi:hypothetical protein
MSKTPLRHVRAAGHNGWRDFVTLNESWFYDHTDDESIWLSGAFSSPERELGMIACAKSILAVVWNPSWFHVADVRSKGVKFRSAYYLSHVMDRLLAALQLDQRDPFRKIELASLPVQMRIDQSFV